MNTLQRIRKGMSAGAGAAVLFLLTVLPAYAAPLSNPLNYDTVADFVAGALKAMVTIALPVVSLFLVIAGFMFIKAQGNEGKLEEAKKNFVYVILGALLIMGAWVIATIIAGTVSQLTAPSTDASGNPVIYKGR